MDDSSQANLFYTIKAVINGVIEDKKSNEKMREKLEDFNAKLNIGLQTEEDFILWVNLIAENGNFQVERGKIDEYDLELIFKKNKFNKETTGWNLGLLFKSIFINIKA